MPEGWKWVRVTELMYNWRSGLERAKSKQSPSHEYPYVKMENINMQGELVLDSVARVNAGSEEVEKYSLNQGDFLFNVRNSAELVGKSCVFDLDTSETWLFNNNILRVDFGDQVSPDFINYWFCSASGRAMLDELKSSTTNVAAIYHKDFFTCVVPLPPLTEQKRIVSVIDRLLPLCDNLDEHLSDLSERGEQLLEAALRDASVDRPDAVPTGVAA